MKQPSCPHFVQVSIWHFATVEDLVIVDEFTHFLVQLPSFVSCFFSQCACQRFVAYFASCATLLWQKGQKNNLVLAKSDKCSATAFTLESKPYRSCLHHQQLWLESPMLLQSPLGYLSIHSLTNFDEIQSLSPTIHTLVSQIKITVMMSNYFASDEESISVYYDPCRMIAWTFSRHIVRVLRM